MLSAKRFRINKKTVLLASLTKSCLFALLLSWVMLSSFYADAQATTIFHHTDAETTSEREGAKLSEQRRLFTQASKLIEAKNWKRLRVELKDLVDYPLYPYLIYSDLIANLSITKLEKISNFLNIHKDSVMADRLRSKWLKYLAVTNQWELYLHFYKEENANVSRQCQYHVAQLKRSHHPKTIENALKLWTVGHSQPKACDQLFSTLVGLGWVDDAHAWFRFKQALIQDNLSLARYAKGFITNEAKITLANSYYDLHLHPQKLTRLIGNLTENSQDRDIISHALRRLARNNPLKALENWHKLRSRLKMPEHEVALLITIVVKKLTTSGRIDKADLLLKEYSHLINHHLDGDVIEWRIRRAIKQQNWDKVLHWIAVLDPPKRHSNIWRYWLIRSLKESDGADVAQISNISRQLSKERDFYGFLISDQLSQPYQFNHKPFKIDDRDLLRVSAIPAIKRAREFFFHGQNVRANREWSSATRNFDRTELLAIGFLSSEWGWHSRAIMAMAQARYWNDLDIRFPVAYPEIIETAAEKSDSERHTLLAIARQESAFDRQAISKAGAIGLMQVMPATAKATARLHNIPYKHKSQLQDVQINSTIGAQYFASLLERFEDNRILAMASYNAGPERVSRWLAQSSGKQPFDVWIETIPFKETRRYVINVLTYSAIYSHLLGNNKSMLTDHERDHLF